MSIFENRFQTYRIRIIENCLRSKAWTKKQLLEHVNDEIAMEYGRSKCIRERTFNDDWKKIKERLEDEDAPLKESRNGSTIYYEYSNKDISCFDESLSKSDIEKLSKAIRLIDQIEGIELNKGLAEIVQKIDTQIRFQAKHEQPVISFQNETVADGHQHLAVIYESIITKTAIVFHYKPFSEKELLKTVYPYYLKQYNNRWFLFGYATDKSRVENFALDRIFGSVSQNKEGYLEPEGFFDPSTYFKDIIGVTKLSNVPKQSIKIHISSVSAPYIRTKKWHASQEVISTAKDGSIIIELQVIPNRELKQLILGLGAAATVLEPKELAKELKEEVAAMYKNYK